MKISEILQESAFDTIAHYHAVPEGAYDHNPEADHFAAINSERYREYFKEFYINGTVPIFSTEVEVDGTVDSKMSNRPADDQTSSAGHRGLELIKSRSNSK